jgi:hypothetical protein
MDGRTPILHFTHETNLERIFGQDGLLCAIAGVNRGA